MLNKNKVHTPDGVEYGKVYTLYQIEDSGRINVYAREIQIKSVDNIKDFKNRLFNFKCKNDREIAGFGMYLNRIQDTVFILQLKYKR